MKLVALIALFVGDISSSRPNARNLDKSGLHSGPDILQRHRCLAQHDDGRCDGQLGVERQFKWWQFRWREFRWRSRRGRAPVDPQRPMRLWFPDGCVG